MYSTLSFAVCFSCLVACVSSAALRLPGDGFILFDLDGNREFTYAVVPAIPRETVKLEFYNVNLPTNTCHDIKIDVYRNGYVKSHVDHIKTLCDTAEANEYTAESLEGFTVVVTTAHHLTVRGEIRARLTADGGVKLTQQVLHR